MKKGQLKTKEVFLRCNECNNIFTIYRLKSKMRPEGHTKHLWCYICREETAHTEYSTEWGLEQWKAMEGL